MKPWERLDRESKEEFALFEPYRRLPPHRRTVQNLLDALGEKAPQRAYLVRLMARNDWEDRARAFDEEAERVRLAGEREARRAMNERQARMGQLLQERAIERLKSLDPEALSPETALHFAEVGAKIERTARGEPDQVVEQRQSMRPEDVKATMDALREAIAEILKPQE